jgi:hypothetical protein
VDAPSPTYTRFAGFDASGRMTALVAEGLPSWPADNDLSSVTDSDLATWEASFLDGFQTLRKDPQGDIALLTTYSQHVKDIRTETARRFAAAANTEPPAPIAPAEPPAPTLSAEEREAALAAMDADLAVPPAEPAPGETITASTAISRDDLVAIVSASTEAATRAMAPTIEALSAAVTAASRPTVTVVNEPAPSAASLGAYRPGNRAPLDNDGKPLTVGQLNPRLVATTDVFSADCNLHVGSPITSTEILAKAMYEKFSQGLGVATGIADEKVPIAQVKMDDSRVPKERDLRGLPWAEAKKKIQLVTGPQAPGVNPFTGKEALVASGGLPYPLEPYYPQLVISQGARPVLEALTTFVADRGGITTVLPPSLATLTAATRVGQFGDGVTATSTALTSASAAFSASDVGGAVVDAGAGVIPTGTVINSVTSATVVVLSQATTGTATSVPFFLPRRNPNNLGNAVGIVTAAQDALGPPTTVKYTYDVVAGGQVSYPVYGIYTSLQFANLTARVNPESVEANIKLADALAARVADSQLLSTLTTFATLMTAAKTFGTARQLLGQLGHEAAFMRNVHRMDPRAIVICGMPAWVVNNMRADYFSTFLGVGAPDWALSDAEIDGWFADRNIMPWYYQDSPADINQLFTSSGITAASGTYSGGVWTAGTPMTLPDYPGSGSGTSFRNHVATYMWAPGAVLGLTTGELNLGLVRDSITNSQNRFRNFTEEWEAAAFVGPTGSLMRTDHSVLADGSYGAAASITIAPGSGL